MVFFILINFLRINFDASSSTSNFIFFCHADIAADKTIHKEEIFSLSFLMVKLEISFMSSRTKISLTVFSDNINDWEIG